MKTKQFTWAPKTKRAKGAPARTFVVTPLGGSPVVITEGEPVEFDRVIGTMPVTVPGETGAPITIGSMLDETLRAQFSAVKE